MAGLRAYAVAVVEVETVGTAPGPARDHLRAIAEAALDPGRPRLRDMLGPIHRRPPGQRVVPPDEPAREDLDVLLDGRPVRPGRAVATWRLVEALVAGLAWSSTSLALADLPTGLLRPLWLPVPRPPGRTAGRCTTDEAATVATLRPWLTELPVWAARAAAEGRAAPDVVVLGTS